MDYTGQGYKIISYPGWVQNDIRPQDIDFTPWTTVFHFGLYPTRTGEVSLGDMQSWDYPTALVNAAHAAGKGAIMVIGGEGQGNRFYSACSPTYRRRFVNNIVDKVNRYGYDGVSFDWEENVSPSRYIETVRMLREKLVTKFLGIDVVSGLVRPNLAKGCEPYVSTINMMSYWSDGMDEYEAYHGAGIAPEKLILGVGLDSDYVDTTVEAVQGKVNAVCDLNLAGIECWKLDSNPEPFYNKSSDGMWYYDDRIVPILDAGF